MIAFYQDAALQDPAVAATPKRFLLPLAGGVKPGTLYLGDPYTATVTAPAAIGAAVVSLDQTFQFPASGSAVVYVPANGSTAASQMVISYTGTSNNSLTGVTGITQTIGDEYLIRPNIVCSELGLFGLVEPSLATVGVSSDNVLAYQLREVVQAVMNADPSYWAQ